MKTLIVIICIFFVSCTAADVGKWRALGDSAHIKCYSGGQVILDDYSTGKIRSEDNSDGYFFIRKSDGKPTEVSADCIIKYDE